MNVGIWQILQIPAKPCSRVIYYLSIYLFVYLFIYSHDMHERRRLSPVSYTFRIEICGITKPIFYCMFFLFFIGVGFTIEHFNADGD